MILRRLAGGVQHALSSRGTVHQRQWFSRKKDATQQSKAMNKDRINRIINVPEPQLPKEVPVDKPKSAATSSIHRQLFNDMVQLPLKYIAYRMAGENSGPFLAELKRSAIDTLNHLVLYFINRVNIGPSTNYPYGMGKLKNFVCNIPATLFVVSGLETIGESVISFMWEAHVSNMSNFESISLYALSIAVELFVVYRNLASANLIKPQEGDTFFKRIKGFVGNLAGLQNPLFQVILYENIVTLTSTLVPLLCEAVHWLFPGWQYIFPTGTLLLGILQIFVGAHLFKANIGYLVGQKAVDAEISKDIVEMVKKSKYIQQVTDIKAVKIGPDAFRSSIDVNINKSYVQAQILKDYKDDIDEIIYEPSVERRRQLLLEFVKEMPIQVLKDVGAELDRLQQKAKLQFPQCTDSDLDFSVTGDDVQEVEKLEHSVQESPQFFKNEAFLAKVINEITSQIDSKSKPKDK